MATTRSRQSQALRLSPLPHDNVTIPSLQLLIFPPHVPPLGFLIVIPLPRFEDTPSLPLIQVNVSFVVVEGQLYAGTALQSFSQLLVFTMLPNPFNRQPLMYTYLPPADPTNPRNLGHKTFAIVREEMGGGWGIGNGRWELREV